MNDIDDKIRQLLDLKAQAFFGRATSQTTTTHLEWLMEAMELLLRERQLLLLERLEQVEQRRADRP
jgi:hypothetical protein